MYPKRRTGQRILSPGVTGKYPRRSAEEKGEDFPPGIVERRRAVTGGRNLLAEPGGIGRGYGIFEEKRLPLGERKERGEHSEKPGFSRTLGGPGGASRQSDKKIRSLAERWESKRENPGEKERVPPNNNLAGAAGRREIRFRPSSRRQFGGGSVKGIFSVAAERATNFPREGGVKRKKTSTAGLT